MATHHSSMRRIFILFELGLVRFWLRLMYGRLARTASTWLLTIGAASWTGGRVAFRFGQRISFY